MKLEIILIISNLIFFLVLFYFWKNFIKIVNIYDIPNKRKIHLKKTPLVGGSIIFLNFFYNFLIFYLLGESYYFYSFLGIETDKFLYFILIIFLCIFLLGLFDDKHNIKNSIKSLVLFIFIYLIILSNPTYEITHIKFSNNFTFSIDRFSIIFTVLSILTLITIMNLYDGINLQSGIFFLMNFIFLFFVTKNPLYLCIIASLFFFILKNYSSKAFMGDSGINFLSIICAIGLLNIYNSSLDLVSFDQILLIFFLPLVDTVRVFLLRIKKKRSPLSSGKDHFHHFMYSGNNLFFANFVSTFFLVVAYVIFYLNLNTLYGFIINLTWYFYFFYKQKMK